MDQVLLSIGHGYSARALTPLLKEKGFRIFGTTRSQDKFVNLQEQGVEALLWPNADMLPFMEKARYLLISAGPDEMGDPFLLKYSQFITAHCFDWVGYLSTTGVYGDHQGDWVDEETPLSPTTERGKLRQSAEEAWQSLDIPLHIFRLAGIYGPGRGPFSKIQNGTARRIIKNNQVFSRIHVEDIAQVLMASIENPNPGRIYNLCDDDPAPPEDVISYAAQILGKAVPPSEDFETAEMSMMARSFYAESKRVSNERIKSELGITLKYPNYKIGLDSLLLDATKKAAD